MESFKEEPSERQTPFNEILAAPLKLSPVDRGMLADRLAETLEEPAQAEIDAAWANEIESRIREIDEGKVKLIPGEEVMERLRPRYKR